MSSSAGLRKWAIPTSVGFVISHECLFSNLKHFPRAATRYDKFAENFLAMAQMASMCLWLLL